MRAPNRRQIQPFRLRAALTHPQYYQPWEPTKAQGETIKDQIYAAEDAIDRERRDFKTQKQQRLEKLGVPAPPRSPSPPPRQRQRQQSEPKPEADTETRSEEATVGEPKPLPQDANPDAVAPPPPTVPPSHHDKDHDENGDEMVQDEEDTVIY